MLHLPVGIPFVMLSQTRTLAHALTLTLIQGATASSSPNNATPLPPDARSVQVVGRGSIFELSP